MTTNSTTKMTKISTFTRYIAIAIAIVPTVMKDSEPRVRHFSALVIHSIGNTNGHMTEHAQ